MDAHEAPSATTRTGCCERSTGAPTYFAADVAYHENKVQRGFDRLIDVLGADHHGYIGRMKGVMAALGHEPDRLEIPILQFVHIVEGGEKAKMSKRRGDFVTLDELIEHDRRRRDRAGSCSRARTSRRSTSTSSWPAKQDPENPVYYVQYAHARIASILRNAEAGLVERALASEPERRRRSTPPSAS